MHFARRIGRRQGGSGLVVLLCATGVALSTTLFAVVKAVLLDPLPYRGADRLTALWAVAESFGIPEYPFSFENYKDYRDRSDVFESLAAWRTVLMTLEGGDRPVSIGGARVTGNFFATLGVEPLIGTGLGDEGDPSRALIGYGLWQREFSGAADVLGRSIRLDGRAYVVAGVLPPELRYPTLETEVFVPLRIREAPETDRAFHFLRLLGRLREGVSLEQAQSRLERIAEYLATTYPDASGELGIRVLPLKEQLVGSTREALAGLFAGGQVLTLLAWANVAILLLARGMARRNEIALRVALGATRRRLVGMLLADAIGLAGLGCLLGLGAGWLAVAALPGIDPGLLPRAWEIRFDADLVLWALGLTLLGGLLFGSAPALWSTRPGSALGTSRTTDRRTARFNAALVALQVALTLPLLVVSSMQLRSVHALQQVDPGFALDGVLAGSVSLPASQFGVAEQGVYVERALAELRRLPGVEAAGAISHLPFTSRAASIVTFRPDQRGGSGLPNAHYRVVSPGLFAAMSLPIVSGRGLEEDDDDPERHSIVVDESLAAVLWPGQDPLGRPVLLGNVEVPWRVVGVAGRARLLALDAAPAYTIYVPVRGNLFPGAMNRPSFMLKSRVPAASLAPSVREVLQSVDPRQAVLEVRPLAAQSDDWLGDRRTLARLLWAIASAALLLAGAGTYAMLSFSVGGRLREMAIRSALGAGARAIGGRVLLEGLRPGVAGAAAGALVCLAGGRVVAAHIHGIAPIDLPSLGAGVALLAGASLLASGAPVRRALRQSPATLLRQVE